jgi:hypothetical protein
MNAKIIRQRSDGNAQTLGDAVTVRRFMRERRIAPGFRNGR